MGTTTRPRRSDRRLGRFARFARFATGGGLVLAVTVAACALGPMGLLSSRKEAVPSERIAARPFERRVPAEGNLAAKRSTPILAPMNVPGPFRIAWLAPDGERVRAGEVVVRFDASEMTSRLTDALADLDSIHAKVAKEQSTDRAELEKLDRDAQLARIELANASQFQVKDALVYSRNEIIESDLDQTLATAREAHAEGVQRTRRAQAQTGLDLLGIQIRSTEQKIALARAGLSALAVSAPHDGVLLLHRNWRNETTRVGDTVWSGVPLAEIPDLSEMKVEAFVLEADASGLAVGKPATVTVESNLGAVYQAHISRVDSLAKPKLLGSPVQYFGVTLELAATDPQVMKPGQRVQAALELERRQSALSVPLEAVCQRDGKNVVYRRAGGAFDPVPVELGPSGAGRVVIEAGLHAGDEIALRDPTRSASAPPAATEQKPVKRAAPAQGVSRGVIMIGLGLAR